MSSTLLSENTMDFKLHLCSEKFCITIEVTLMLLPLLDSSSLPYLQRVPSSYLPISPLDATSFSHRLFRLLCALYPQTYCGRMSILSCTGSRVWSRVGTLSKTSQVHVKFSGKLNWSFCPQI